MSASRYLLVYPGNSIGFAASALSVHFEDRVIGATISDGIFLSTRNTYDMYNVRPPSYKLVYKPQ